MQVSYDVPAGTPIGSYALTFNQDNPNTDPDADYVNTISNFSPNLFTVNAVNGFIVVESAEPSSGLLVLLAAAALLGFRRLRVRRA
jgi:hypothetical protein